MLHTAGRSRYSLNVSLHSIFRPVCGCHGGCMMTLNVHCLGEDQMYVLLITCRYYRPTAISLCGQCHAVLSSHTYMVGVISVIWNRKTQTFHRSTLFWVNEINASRPQLKIDHARSVIWWTFSSATDRWNLDDATH